MESDKRFGVLRNVLRVFGLPQEAVDDIVNWIADLVAGKSDKVASQAPEFPYHLRDNFLSSAEFSFYEVLKAAIGDRAVISAKVGLNDLFWVKPDDQSRFRIYTNKIDRKHVDFLLCEPTTMHPLLGIELDDKSHQRPDRQARDAFVDQVFAAAKLPIVHVPVRRNYMATEIAAQLAPYLRVVSMPTPIKPINISAPSKAAPIAPITTVKADDSPRCPKCGGQMVLRTAKNGANAGNRFWGCSTYPTCRAMMPYQASG